MTGLKSKVLILNGKEYTKDDFLNAINDTGDYSSTRPTISFQSITIDNQQNLKKYELYGWHSDWTYKVYLGTMGDLDKVMEMNSNYKYEIKDGIFYLDEYDWNGPKTFLIIGVSS